MEPTKDFDELIERLRAGVPDALRQLMKDFNIRLVQVAERYLGSQARVRVDIEELVLWVLLKCSQDLAHNQLEVHDWNHLKNLLGFMTRRECSRQVRYLTQSKRDYRRERLMPPSGADVEDPWEGFSREPWPEEAAYLDDEIKHMMLGCTKRDRTVLELYLAGASPREVAAQLGCCARTVERVVEDARARLGFVPWEQRANENFGAAADNGDADGPPVHPSSKRWRRNRAHSKRFRYWMTTTLDRVPLYPTLDFRHGSSDWDSGVGDTLSDFEEFMGTACLASSFRP